MKKLHHIDFLYMAPKAQATKQNQINGTISNLKIYVYQRINQQSEKVMKRFSLRMSIKALRESKNRVKRKPVEWKKYLQIIYLLKD